MTPVVFAPRCLACDGQDLYSAPAVVAPFLAHRIWKRPPFAARLERCGQCGFCFFNPRMEPAEEALLYAGYRDADYVAERNRFEPWYTATFNANIERPEFLEARKRLIRELLKAQMQSVRSVLDFGGARGEVVQDLIPDAAAYVYDISRVHPVTGVIACKNISECRALDPDLVLSSNVLEHVGNPKQHLEELAQACGPNTRVWIEVPFERPGSVRLWARRIAQMGILSLMRPRIALSLMQPGVLNLLHEHVNYFTGQALRSLLETSGWQVGALSTYELSGYFGKGRMIWAMASLR